MSLEERREVIIEAYCSCVICFGIHVFLLLLILFFVLQKKFWVEVKPVNSKEKKLFMVVHDDGVTATANPESATFPDTCEVELNMADADLLHKQKGIIIGVRNPDTNLYQVQLHRIKGQEKTIEKLGSPVVVAKENELKWNNVRPDEKTETEQGTKTEQGKVFQGTETERAYLSYNNKNPSKQKKLPARPTFNLFPDADSGNSTKSRTDLFSPSTAASLAPPAGGSLADVCPSPPQPRSQLDSPSFRSGTHPFRCSLCFLSHASFSTFASRSSNQHRDDRGATSFIEAKSPPPNTRNSTLDTATTSSTVNPAVAQPPSQASDSPPNTDASIQANSSKRYFISSAFDF